MNKPNSDDKKFNIDMRVFTCFIDKGKNNKYSFERHRNGVHIVSTAFDGTQKNYTYNLFKNIIQITSKDEQKRRYFVIDKDNNIYEYSVRKVPNKAKTFCLLLTQDNGTTISAISTTKEITLSEIYKEYKELKKIKIKLFVTRIAVCILFFMICGCVAYMITCPKHERRENDIKQNTKDSLFVSNLQSNKEYTYLYRKDKSIKQKHINSTIQNQH